MTDTSGSRPDIRETNKGVIASYRASGGTGEGQDRLVLVTTKGTTSGAQHTTPVCVREDGDVLVVAGTMGGNRRHPQWYRNLVAEPEVTVEYRGDTYQARASTMLNGPERDEQFARMNEVIPGMYGYQDRCREFRQIPIVRLERIS